MGVPGPIRGKNAGGVRQAPYHTHLRISMAAPEVSTCSAAVPISQMGAPCTGMAQGQQAAEQQSQDENPSALAPEASLLVKD